MQTKIGKYAPRILILASILLIFGVIKWHMNTQNSPSKDTVSVPISQVIAGDAFWLDQNDDRVINFIWEKHYIKPPSEFDYKLTEPNVDPSRGQGEFIRNLFQNMTGGFFVEAGALDGETRSNTLFLEQHLNWKGLLVEGDPSNFAILETKNRKAWVTNTCLAIKPYPHSAEFLQHFNTGKILSLSKVKSKKSRQNTTRVQCMPFISLMRALDISEVDYFSLDVEGNELDVLKTIPFDKIFIKTLSVEFQHTGGGKDAILKFMKSKGYNLAAVMSPPEYKTYDVMLVHNTFKT